MLTSSQNRRTHPEMKFFRDTPLKTEPLKDSRIVRRWP